MNFDKILALAMPVLFSIISAIVLAVVLPNIVKLPALTSRLLDWVAAQAAHVKSTYIAGVLARAAGVVRDVVIEFENTEIETLKEQLAGGQITQAMLPGLLAIIKQHAIDKAKELFTAQNLLADLEKIFIDKGLEQWVSHQIEASVAALPASGLQTPKESK